MAAPPKSYQPESQFKRGAKIDDSAMIALCWSFCQGLPLDKTALVLGVSRKTVRQFYIDLRQRLAKPKFARWHGAHLKLINISDPNYEALIKSVLLTLMADCYANSKCQQNHRYGLRKERLCGKCPLNGKFKDAPMVHGALALIDAVRTFYRLLGLRGERGQDAITLFWVRLIHTVTIATARNNSRALGNGFNPVEKKFMSLGTLLDTLLEDLAEDPL